MPLEEAAVALGREGRFHLKAGVNEEDRRDLLAAVEALSRSESAVFGNRCNQASRKNLKQGTARPETVDQMWGVVREIQLVRAAIGDREQLATDFILLILQGAERQGLLPLVAPTDVRILGARDARPVRASFDDITRRPLSEPRSRAAATRSLSSISMSAFAIWTW